MKNILIITPTLSGGGAEGIIKNLIKLINHTEFYITLIVIHDCDLNIEYKNVEVYVLNKKGLKYALLDILRIMFRTSYDVVLTSHYHYTLLIAFVVKFFPNIKMIARESSIRSLRISSPVKLLITRIVYNFFVDNIIAQSSYMKDDLISNCKIAHNKINVIYNLLDKEHIKQQLNYPITDNIFHKTFNLIALGRLEYVKGFDLLIKEISILVKFTKDFKLNIFGDGKEKTNLISLIKEYNLEKVIQIHPYTHNPYPYINKSNLLIISSRVEGFPNVALEASLLETNVLAYNIPGGIQDIDFINKVEYTEGLMAMEILKYINGVKPNLIPNMDLNKFTKSINDFEKLFNT